MMTLDNSIMNMLAAPSEIMPSPVASPSGEAPAEGALFGDLLNSLLSGQVVDPGILLSPAALNMKSLLSEVNELGSVEGEPVPPELTGKLPTMSTPKNMLAVAKTLNLVGLTGHQGPSKTELPALLSDNSGQSLSGSHRIIAFGVIDDRLLLTLQADDKTAQQIQLTIPLSQLSHDPVSIMDKSGLVDGFPGKLSLRSTQRVTRQSGAEMERLLSGLKFKSLEIGSNTDSETKQEPEPVRAKIVAENNGNEILIRANLSKQQLQVVPVNKPFTVSEVKNKVEKISGKPNDELSNGRAEPATNSKPDPLAETTSQTPGQRAAIPIKDHPWLKESGLAGKMIDSQTRHQAAQTTPEIDSRTVKFDHSERLDTRQLPTPATRYILPENITGNLKPNGQSVMIRIEPEFLGPIRLNLAMRGELLTARVTVESVQVQAVVEKSLDQLAEQLARAGVKVDHVEVNLAGDNMRNQFMDRRADWQLQKKTPRSASMNGQHHTELESLISPPPQATAYLSRTGVNLYA